MYSNISLHSKKYTHTIIRQQQSYVYTGHSLVKDIQYKQMCLHITFACIVCPQLTSEQCA